VNEDRWISTRMIINMLKIHKETARDILKII
jgi:hypothetical protein